MNNTSAGPNNLGLPYATIPLVDPQTGVITRPWWPFISSLYQRVGGPTAPSNLQLESMLNNNASLMWGDDSGQDEPFTMPGMQGSQGIQGSAGYSFLLNDDNYDDAATTALSVLPNNNLTGPITSAGNVTSVASQTGTGSTFVMNNSPTLITPTLGVANATSINKVNFAPPTTAATFSFPVDNATFTLQGTDTYIGRATTDTLTNKTYDTAGTGNVLKINGTQVSAVTGSGSVVLATSPALTTPNLGTPSALVGTNITGTAPALNIGGNAATVTTNANLTGPITSVGNATSIASQTGTGTKFVVDTSPTLVTPNLGTPTALVGTNITGTASALNIGGNAATATTATNQSGGTVSATTITATTGAITPHYPSGIVGNASGSVTAGSIGENYSSSVTSGALTSGVQTNVTSITVTAGVWLAMGLVNFIPGGSTTVGNDFAGFTTTSASLSKYISFVPPAGAVGTQYGLALTTTLFIVGGGGATIYGVVDMIFSGGGATASIDMSVVRIG